jgi:membrane-bound ClpP family serine protease
MFGIDQTLICAIGLLLLGVGCIVLEMFVPSGGLLGLLATLSILGAILLAFLSGPIPGLVMTLTVTFLIPGLLAVAVKYWPETPLGRLILLRRPKSDDVLPLTEAYRSLQQLVGKHGIAKSRMLPSGVVSIEGKSYDAVSNGLPIEPGQNVRVIGLDTQRLVVRADDEPFKETLVSAGEEALDRPLSESPLPGIEDPFA